MAEAPKTESADWTALAQEALDLWQDHLAAMAADPKAKAEMTQLIAPLSALMSTWTQAAGKQGPTAHDGVKKQPGRPDGLHPHADDGASSAVGAQHVAELTDRVAELERHIDELERRLAGTSSSPAAASADDPGKGAKRGRRVPSGSGD